MYFVARPFHAIPFVRLSSKVKVTKAAGKSCNIVGIFSGTITTMLMKAGTVLVRGKVFLYISVIVTFTQGHSSCQNDLKFCNTGIFSHIIVTAFLNILQDGTPFQNLLLHITSSDLCARSRSLGQGEILENTKTGIFSAPTPVYLTKPILVTFSQGQGHQHQPTTLKKREHLHTTFASGGGWGEGGSPMSGANPRSQGSPAALTGD